MQAIFSVYTDNACTRFWNTPVLLEPQTLQQLITTPYKLNRTMLNESSLAAHKVHQQTTYITKYRYLHYKIISTCDEHNVWQQLVQILITHANLCCHINQLHVSSKLPHKHYTQDSSTPSLTL